MENGTPLVDAETLAARKEERMNSQQALSEEIVAFAREQSNALAEKVAELQDKYSLPAWEIVESADRISSSYWREARWLKGLDCRRHHLITDEGIPF